VTAKYPIRISTSQRSNHRN